MELASANRMRRCSIGILLLRATRLRQLVAEGDDHNELLRLIGDAGYREQLARVQITGNSLEMLVVRGS